MQSPPLDWYLCLGGKVELINSGLSPKTLPKPKVAISSPKCKDHMEKVWTSNYRVTKN